MRIIAGRFRGLRLHGPPPGAPTRPTTDKVREALFSSLTHIVPGGSFLDLYAGTGAISIEAYSRGAARVVLVEAHPRALATVRKNLALVGSPVEVEVRARRVERVLAAADSPFDVVFADPPFKVPPDKVLALAAASAAVGPETRLLIEYRRDKNPNYPEPLAAAPGLVQGKTYRFGEKEFTAYRRAEA